ncbi:MAG: hypothetical protein LBT01_03865 [Spirochaetaceae bacterium]|jgi:hypothetical protein|nr:hypothetical protein [Spirochaetaceae bacterium]
MTLNSINYEIANGLSQFSARLIKALNNLSKSGKYKFQTINLPKGSLNGWKNETGSIDYGIELKYRVSFFDTITFFVGLNITSQNNCYFMLWVDQIENKKYIDLIKQVRNDGYLGEQHESSDKKSLWIYPQDVWTHKLLNDISVTDTETIGILECCIKEFLARIK